jgi:large subunit ribosomal protein L29
MQERRKLRPLKYNKEENRVARLKLKALREMNDGDIQGKLSEMKADLAKLKLERSKGTLKKSSANIKWLRRDIARMNTILNERKSKE